MHCSVNSFGCPGCHKGFRSPKVLTDHIRTFHGSGMICIMDSKDQTEFDSTKTKSKKKVADKCSSSKSRMSETKDTAKG